MTRSRRISNKIDGTTFSIYLSLIAVGWLMIYTVGQGDESNLSFLQTSAGKQAVWMGISLVAFFFIILIEWKFWQTFSYLIYGISILLLIAVLIFGSTIKGATSWFSFGSSSFQPSEIAKFATCLAISNFLSTYNTDIRDFKMLVTACGIFLLPMGFILLQPDAGSALVFTSFLLLLYREGLSATYFIVGAFAISMLLLGFVFPIQEIGIGLLWTFTLVLTFNFKSRKWLAALTALGFFTLGALLLSKDQVEVVIISSLIAFLLSALYVYRSKKSRIPSFLIAAGVFGIGLSFASNYAFNNVLLPHQQDRINVWLQPSICDPGGNLYHVLQSKMAISSGGLQGKGFMNGTMTKLNYIPEQSTDFIFCTIGEEQGFIGTFGIIALFFLLLYRILMIAERQRSGFSRRYAYAVAGIIFVHFFINIGMTMGLMPIIGIPLPFISKGGSSLLGFTIMMAVLLKLDSHRANA